MLVNKRSTYCKCRICESLCDECFVVPYSVCTSKESPVDYFQQIYECRVCGYVGVVNPAFEDQDYIINYEETAKYEGSPESRVTANDYSRFQERQTCVLNGGFQRSFVSAIDNDIQSVLDIGASSGFLLSLFDGKERMGVEPSYTNQQIAKNVYNVNLFKGFFEDFDEKYPQREYDLVIASHILEHVLKPVDFITSIKNHSAKYILIDVPTIDNRYRGYPFDLFCEEHISYFSFNVIKRILESGKKRFELIRAVINLSPQALETVGFPSLLTLWKVSNNYVDSIIMPQFRTGHHGFLDVYMAESEKEYYAIFERIKSKCKGKKVAFFCAGTNTEKFFGLGGCKDLDVVVIYDNSEKKQGLYLGGVPIKIFDIDDIRNGIIDRIIISTNNYQGEIHKLLIDKGVPLEKIIHMY